MSNSFFRLQKRPRLENTLIFFYLLSLWAIKITGAPFFTLPTSQNRFHSRTRRWLGTLNIVDTCSYIGHVLIVYRKPFVLGLDGSIINSIICLRPFHFAYNSLEIWLIGFVFVRMDETLIESIGNRLQLSIECLIIGQYLIDQLTNLLRAILNLLDLKLTLLNIFSKLAVLLMQLVLGSSQGLSHDFPLLPE